MPAVFHAGTADTEKADGVGIAHAVGNCGHLRGHADGKPLSVALDDQGQRGALIEADDLLDFLEPLDRLAVDLDDDVARQHAGLGRGAVGLNGTDVGRREGLAVDREKQRQADDREQEIGDRTGRDDGGALAEALMEERDFPFLRRHGRTAPLACWRHPHRRTS